MEHGSLRLINYGRMTTGMDLEAPISDTVHTKADAWEKLLLQLAE